MSVTFTCTEVCCITYRLSQHHPHHIIVSHMDDTLEFLIIGELLLIASLYLNINMFFYILRMMSSKVSMAIQPQFSWSLHLMLG